MSPCLDIVVAVTHRCNARCVMCNIWKSREQDGLRPEHMRKLPRSLRTVNLSGGEPFLRDDLPVFVRELRNQCPGARITISTNGYLSGRIAEMMREIVRIDEKARLAVSLDGIGDAHDRMRGTDGAFARAVELIDTLTGDGYRGLRLQMTLSASAGNLDQLSQVAKLSRDRGLELGIVPAHASRTHLGVDEVPVGSVPMSLKEGFERVIADWCRSWNPKQWFRAHFAYNTYRYLSGAPFSFRCHAGQDFCFLHADGTVYSCSVRGKPMGNIVEQSWDEIWKSPAARKGRNAAHRCTENCWMICTARSVYRRRMHQIIPWIFTNKILSHLGLLELPAPSLVGGKDARVSSVANTAR